jgi:hypothetical protein
MTTMIDTLLADWRSTIGDQALHSSSRVQALLFELWGETEGPARELVQEWLTVTLHRELFGTEELEELFGRLESLVPSAS